MFVTVNGIQLYYEVVGSGPAMIMLHNNMKDHTVFAKPVKILQQYYTVYLVDSRGHGQSQAVPEYHFEDMADDMAEFITTLEIDKPVIYGLADGAEVALILAMKHPELISKMVLSGALSDPDTLSGWDIKRARSRAKSGKGDARERMMVQEPKLSDQDLKKVKVPVYLFYGEFDAVDRYEMIHMRDTLPMTKKVKLYKFGDRLNYAIDDQGMAKDIIELLLGITYVRKAVND